MSYQLVIVGPLETNCYLFFCPETRECAIIDPGAEPEKIFEAISSLSLKPTIIINTHGHVDHTGANLDLRERYHIPIALHPADLPLLEECLQLEFGLMLGARPAPVPDHLLADGEKISIGQSVLQVIHSPGHSPGSVCFYTGHLLFAGDTLFSGGVGRTDLPGGSWKDLAHSLKARIMTLPDETVVLPGHGPKTTISEEKESNPYLE
ncbi:MAG TPA: MBL fold metallo-hydrolase [Candidatus Saccharicenans sp.]|jgi:glyoxylase-like metal-dependent hydrolase (beta-lactamase superfamily II)|nr:MBL fold metallo-hydrolase [Candidatus Saccharicenans sp.]HRD02765.1 MBL fold metallo-hydrolase [Candidatus Saccharicenans sp.]